jgi:hypothetical protein
LHGAAPTTARAPGAQAGATIDELDATAVTRLAQVFASSVASPYLLARAK